MRGRAWDGLALAAQRNKRAQVAECSTTDIQQIYVIDILDKLSLHCFKSGESLKLFYFGKSRLSP
jgi:hypothetical protein